MVLVIIDTDGMDSASRGVRQRALFIMCVTSTPVTSERLVGVGRLIVRVRVVMLQGLNSSFENAASHMLDVQPLSIHIGAEIDGADLSRPLSDDQIAEIRATLLQWKVVFFRNQSLNHQEHIDFARQFGEPTPGHVVFGGDDTYPEIYSIAKERTANRNRHLAALRPWSGWHTDITAAINPPWGSILRGDVVPPYGGDTQWTNLAAAFASLSDAMQRFVETLHAEHRLTLDEHTLASIHPLVRVHPETGECAYETASSQ